MARICSGFGDCWESNGENYKYPNVICDHDCQPKNCANALVCGHYNYPEWVVNFKYGCCIHCAREFGKVLEFSEDECPVCLETKTCVTMLNCSHKECITCFKRATYGADPPPQPEFPFPDRWDEYEDGLLDDHPLIVEWNRKMDAWGREREENYESERYLRCCPLCRK